MDRAHGVFAELPALQRLKLSGRVPLVQRSAVSAASAAMPAHIVDVDLKKPEVVARLRSLAIAAVSDVMPTLSNLLLGVTELSLYIRCQRPVLPTVAALTMLQSLKLCLA